MKSTFAPIYLRFALALLFGVSLAASASNPAPTVTPEQRAAHVLNRLGYGPRPGDIERVVAIGVDAYIAQQLHPETIPEPAALKAALADLPEAQRSYADLLRDYGPAARRQARNDKSGENDEAEDEIDSGNDDRARDARARQRQALLQAQQARLLRALDSPRQLEQVMTDFWFNHFNVFAGKGLDRLWIAPYEREAIRPYVLGNFRDLLGATAKSPAMLFYLDNWRSSAAGSERRGKAEGLNENYARELMELHTLGVDGGYTQKDVTELARVFTGWTFDRRGLRNGNSDGFYFDARRHDEGEKVVLGEHYANAGIAEGEHALDRLAASPATAHHLAFQLAQYFVSDDPPSALVEQLAAKFRSSRGDIRAVLAVLFASEQFRDPAIAGAKFKTPYEFVLSALRAADVRSDNPRPLLGALRLLGMPLYGCVTPDGYKNTASTWLTPNAMVDRTNFAAALGSGKLPANQGGRSGAADDAGADSTAETDHRAPDAIRLATPDTARVLSALRPMIGDRTQRAVDAAPPRLRSGLLLGSPEFMRR